MSNKMAYENVINKLLLELRHLDPERADWWEVNLSYKAPEQMPEMYVQLMGEIQYKKEKHGV